MTTNQTKMEDNTAGRDLAGRDIIHHHNYGSDRISTLRELAAKLRLDSDDNAQIRFISELQHFAQPQDFSPSRDLEQKLEESSRADVLYNALEWKERFSKKLIRLQFSLQAQELFVHILSKIHTFFLLQVRPRVLEGASRTEIDNLVYDLIAEIYSEVGESELGLTMADLQGMVYFLAGNCHIDWG